MATRSFKRFVEQELGYFPKFVIYAILEWVVIFLLFLDGFIGFFANEFARFFELQAPCLLCSRIDHVLVHRTPKFYYNNSLCEDHKKDVSSLAYCHAHRKLSDIRRMCEGCLISFATDRGSDCETQGSLVGILRKNIESSVDDDRKMPVKMPVGTIDMTGVHQCSCCGVPMKMKAPVTKANLRTSASHGSLVSLGPTPSPRAPFVPMKNEDFRNMELPSLPPIKNMDHKVFSDNESELPEDEYSLYASIPGREDVKASTVPLLPESEDSYEDRTPMGFSRGNKFFGISLTDSATSSPRWATRLPRKTVLDKAEVFSESLEGNATNESDPDSIMQRLKRQARLDRKSLIALYMELDEERSASAIAANNAMAMITRLQAEKAAVRMEALQYQRMMEEQAEYDQEDLQAMREMLGKKEDEIKALEAELEMYRQKDESSKNLSVQGFDSVEIRGDEDDEQLKSQSLSEESECGSPAFCFEVENKVDEPSGEFEVKRSYPLNSLEKLEMKSDSLEKQAEYGQEDLQAMRDLLGKREEEIKDLKAELDMQRQKNASSKNISVERCDLIETHGAEYDKKLKSQSLSENSGCSSPAVENNGENRHKYDQTNSAQEENEQNTVDEPSRDFEVKKPHPLNRFKKLEKKFISSSQSRRHSLQLSFDVNDTAGDTGDMKDKILREVPHLHEKLEAFEAEGGFLSHAARALEKGNEGKNLLIEIAQHLHKLQDLVKIPLEYDCE